MPVLSMFAFASVAAAVALHTRASVPAIYQVSQADWASLNTTVKGRLSGGRPLALPCYDNYNGSAHVPDLAACSNIEAQKANGSFIADQPGGYIQGNWAGCQSTGEYCNLAFLGPDVVNPLLTPCKQGSVSPYYIDVQEVSDVQAGLAFAKQHSIPISIKNSGHDYKGRSSAPDSLSLWTHHVTPPIKLTRNYVADGCSSSNGDAITVGAGQGFEGVYQFAHANQLHIVGGTSETVGMAGGWITGGGHSALSNTLGLGVDNAQQIKAVLPNGTYITANRCQNQDLFYALRGGGGGTFGVIMELTTTAHPATQLQAVNFTIASLSPTDTKQFLSILVENANKWASEGWGGYALPAIVSESITSMIAITPKLTLDQAKESMKPITDFIANMSSTSIALTNNIGTVQDFYEFFGSPTAGGLQNVNGIGYALSSRIVPSKNFDGAANQQATTDAMWHLVESAQNDSTLPILPLFICITAPSNYALPSSDQVGGPGAAAVTPAWRNSPWHVIHYRSFDTANPLVGDLSGADSAFARAHSAMQPLRQLSPGSGAYLNECDTFEPDYTMSFWGRDNYNRLLSIKKQVDPDNILTGHQAVGWNPADSRYKCYPKDPN